MAIYHYALVLDLVHYIPEYFDHRIRLVSVISARIYFLEYIPHSFAPHISCFRLFGPLSESTMSRPHGIGVFVLQTITWNSHVLVIVVLVLIKCILAQHFGLYFIRARIVSSFCLSFSLDSQRIQRSLLVFSTCISLLDAHLISLPHGTLTQSPNGDFDFYFSK